MKKKQRNYHALNAKLRNSAGPMKDQKKESDKFIGRRRIKDWEEFDYSSEALEEIMKSPIVVGVAGAARSGKDTVADYLVRRYGFKRIAFADSLKLACQHIFGLTDAQLWGKEKEVLDSFWNLTPRYILQKVGTECMREVFDKDIWIRSVEKHIQSDLSSDWVIPDVRFPNEAQAIKDWGGILVKTNREKAQATGGIEGHASENALNDFNEWDYSLDNNGELIELYEEIDRIFG